MDKYDYLLNPFGIDRARCGRDFAEMITEFSPEDRNAAVRLCETQAAFRIGDAPDLEATAARLSVNENAVKLARAAFHMRDTWIPLNQEWLRAADDIRKGRPLT